MVAPKVPPYDHSSHSKRKTQKSATRAVSSTSSDSTVIPFDAIRRVLPARQQPPPTLRSVAEDSAPTNVPGEFSRAVASLTSIQPRPDVRVEHIRPPQRLAPWSFALGGDVIAGGVEVAAGRLVLLHDPAGYDSWDGTFRFVSYATAELDADMAHDPLLPEVAWSWLLDSLAHYGAHYIAAGGTITQTSSTRFGDLTGPEHTVDIELRTSWTPLDDDLGNHYRAWMDLLCTAAGVPPPGVTVLSQRRTADE